MHLNEDPLSLYDLLELTPDATPQEIRSAYLRLKSAYGKDNIAHYGVFSRDETEQMLRNVENAYLVLSNPEKRRAYDQGHGLSPAMATAPAASPDPLADHWSNPVSSATSASLASLTLNRGERPASLASSVASSVAPSPEQDAFIGAEETWTGPALRKVRESRRITLEDLSDYTRISRSYLHALEEENFAKLPAVVYVRGFLQQISKRLKLPVEQVTRNYLDRMKASAPEKI
jgi:flagellar biosynthesis protein FlhG